MPLVPSNYQAPAWLSHPHAQTILRGLLPALRSSLPPAEILELPDGDFLQLHWHLPHPASAPLAILCHGLEGHAGSSYIRSLTRALALSSCNTLSWSYRGCGSLPNRLARSYHSGATEDLAAVVEHALLRASGPLLLAGFSLGGNLILKYLGERVPPPRIAAAAAVSAPVDLATSADVLDQHRANALYRRRFVATLTRKAADKARRFPGQVPPCDWSAIRTVRAFDDAYTAPLHGFADAADYYARCSALPLLGRLSLPSLLLNALDDPLLSRLSYPSALAASHPFLHFESPARGGHVGFFDRRFPLRSWLDTRLPAFFLQSLDAR